MAEDLQGDGTVTADEVAALAGVSRWTVARAFKKEGSISAKSRKRVMEVAEKLGYVPDLSAAALASDRSNLVALLVDDFDNPHKLVMLERLTRILREAGYGTLLVNMLGEKDAPDALLTASQRRVDAAVLIGTQFDESIRRTALGARRVRKVVVFARMGTSPDTLSIGCDDVAAMEEVTRHVLSRGYTRPLFLAGPDTESTRLFRKETFLRVWTDESRSAEPLVIHANSYSSADGRSCAIAYLRSVPRDQMPDVILCENDVLALGAIDAVRGDLGLQVPKDIAITGFDDIPLAGSSTYDLTTYRQPITEMVHALVRLLNSDGQASQSTVLKGKFVARGSA
jgi:DNA-binding LacI/PurR family transcriptional regulator